MRFSSHSTFSLIVFHSVSLLLLFSVLISSINLYCIVSFCFGFIYVHFRFFWFIVRVILRKVFHFTKINSTIFIKKKEKKIFDGWTATLTSCRAYCVLHSKMIMTYNNFLLIFYLMILFLSFFFCVLQWHWVLAILNKCAFSEVFI